MNHIDNFLQKDSENFVLWNLGVDKTNPQLISNLLEIETEILKNNMSNVSRNIFPQSNTTTEVEIVLKFFSWEIDLGENFHFDISKKLLKLFIAKSKTGGIMKVLIIDEVLDDFLINLITKEGHLICCLKLKDFQTEVTLSCSDGLILVAKNKDIKFGKEKILSIKLNNAKGMVQHLCQRHKSAPEYLTKRNGLEHNPIYVSILTIKFDKGSEYEVLTGKGKSVTIKEAEKQAALDLLITFNVNFSSYCWPEHFQGII